MQNIGKMLILLGCLVIVMGVVLYFFSDNLGFIGKLPGYISIERENFRIYIPITTMLLLSLIVSIVGWLIKFLLQVNKKAIKF